MTEGNAGIEGLVLGGGEYCCVGVVCDNVAPHFQQTDSVGGLPLPQLGQMGIGGPLASGNTSASDSGRYMSLRWLDLEG